MCSQVAGEGVTTAAGVAAEGALEGLLACVELDVAQQVTLLGEGHATLAALEGPVPCREWGGGTRAQQSIKGNSGQVRWICV